MMVAVRYFVSYLYLREVFSIERTRHKEESRNDTPVTFFSVFALEVQKEEEKH